MLNPGAFSFSLSDFRLPALLGGGRQRVRTPTVLQMEVLECGAACLAMILGAFGRFVSLEELRYECGVSRDGSKASNIIKAARRYGLKAKGFTKEPGALRRLPLPLVVFWNFNHFVVVEGFQGRKVHLNDPATGPRKITDKEFDEAFTGVALAFEPGPDFKKGGTRPNWLTGLRRRLRGSWWAFGFVVLSSLGLVVPGLLVPAFSRVFVDFYLIEGLDDWLLPLLGGMLATALLRGGLVWLQQHHLLRLQTKLSLTASGRFFWHMLRLPMGFFAQRFGAEVGTRLQLNDRVAQLVAGDLSVTLLNMITMGLYALIMIQYDVVLTAVGLAFAFLNLIAFSLVARKLADAHQRLLLDKGKLTGIAMQGLQMIDDFKASGTDSLFFARWAGTHVKVINAEQSLSRWRTILNNIPVLLTMLATVTILVIGGERVMEGSITIGMLIAFQSLMTSFSAPVTSLVGLGGQMQEAQGILTRIDDVMEQPAAREFDTVAKPSPGMDKKAGAAPAEDSATRPASVKLNGHVQAQDVTFGFIPTDPPLVDGLVLDLPPGKRIALVGASGSGKSTVGRLVAGLYPPWDGEIRIDGQRLTEIPRADLRSSVALVDQDIVLFEGTVRDNIPLWDTTMPEERIIAAAKDAAIHDDISERPGGYDLRIAEGGGNLSTGQRQRVELARALAGLPSVLVLDEATSALDPATERIVMGNLRRRGCSCLIIAHRLSTIRDCDEILVLDRGRVIERGRHGALMAADGPYKRLIES